MMDNRIVMEMNYVRISVVLLLMLALTGCAQSGKEDLQAFVEEVQTQENSPIEPIPEIKIHQNFAYAASDLRDPFESTAVEVQDLLGDEEDEIVSNGIKPNAHRLKEALEEYELSELRLVGLLEKGRKSAMVRGPDGVVHLIGVGNYVGKNNGKILEITDSGLTLREVVSGEKFAFVERENTLLLGGQDN